MDHCSNARYPATPTPFRCSSCHHTATGGCERSPYQNDTGRVNNLMNGPEAKFRTIDGLSIRYAASEERDDQALLLGHFVWEDASDEYAALVTSWWSVGYAAPDLRRG